MMPSETMGMLVVVVVLAVVMTAGVTAQDSNNSLTEVEPFLEEHDTEGKKICNNYMEKLWNHYTNINPITAEEVVLAHLESDLWKQNMSHRAAEFDTTDLPPQIQRQLAKIQDIGTAALKNTSKLRELDQLEADMSTVYSTAVVCLNGRCLVMHPDIIHEFKTSRSEPWLRELWLGWRKNTGKKLRELYTRFVSLSNEAIRTLGYDDTGAYWRSKYETSTFEQDVDDLFQEIKPLYAQLHAFVRHRLKEQYGEEVFPSSGHIPAHLLGDPWAMQWHEVESLTKPFPNVSSPNVTNNMTAQNYTARKMFEVADDFFTSLGLDPMPQEFWDKSMLEKPEDGRIVVCPPSVWDFYNGTDFRIKMCTEVTMEDLDLAHRGVGILQYAIHYRDQPFIFRSGANPGFFRAVGDVVSLSVETPKHLEQIGLLSSVVENTATKINFLMAMALEKVAFLPFGYLVDQWRWSVFRGDTTPDNYNQAWWDLRCKQQGVSPPVARTEEFFDPGAVHPIPYNTPFISYFVSFVIQFQLHQALCDAAGHLGPLHTCDIYNSTEAGDKLRAMMSNGSSEVWTVPFEALTGQTKMSAQPLIQYFQPLMDYLEQYNQDHDVKVGWEEGCPSTTSAAGLVSLTSPVFLLVTLLNALP